MGETRKSKHEKAKQARANQKARNAAQENSPWYITASAEGNNDKEDKKKPEKVEEDEGQIEQIDLGIDVVETSAQAVKSRIRSKLKDLRKDKTRQTRNFVVKRRTLKKKKGAKSPGTSRGNADDDL